MQNVITTVLTVEYMLILGVVLFVVCAECKYCSHFGLKSLEVDAVECKFQVCTTLDLVTTGHVSQIV